MIDKDKSMEYAAKFLGHCIGQMQEYGQLNKENFPAEFALINETLERIDLKNALKEMNEITGKDLSPMEGVQMAEEDFAEDKQPWVSCINTFLSVDRIHIKCHSDEVEQKLEEIVEKAKKIATDAKIVNKIIPKRIEMLQFKLFDGERHLAILVGRVQRSMDKTIISDLVPLDEFIQSINEDELCHILEKKDE